MYKIAAITWKELYTTFRDRNLILIMFLTPVALSTIIGLAFSGLGDDNGMAAFQDIPIAVVNEDEGFRVADQIPIEPGSDDATGSQDGLAPSLNDLEVEVGGETVNIGETLQSNPNLKITDTGMSAENAAFNFGDTLTGILLATPVTAATGATATNGFNLDNLTCPLLGNDEVHNGAGSAAFGFQGELSDLLETVEMDDAAAARAAVDRGEYVAAVIIPPDFSAQIVPSFDFDTGNDAGAEETEASNGSDTVPDAGAGAVAVYANAGQSISAGIVRAVVEGIVNQFVRIGVSLESMVVTSAHALTASLNLGELADLDLRSVDPQLVTENLQSLDASILDPLACLLLPGGGNVRLTQQPLGEMQTRSSFALVMILVGSAQAIFFAMFTGIFGINSIYQEQENWTLQRLIAAPIPRSFILAGKLLGNVVVVMAQLVILFTAFTLIASLVEGKPTFIWGTHIPALVAVILGIALFVSGLGVLIVGLAKNSEQVQIFGPIVAVTLGALGGSFGFRLPPQVAGFSPIWWGTQALQHVAAGETGALGAPLLALFGAGVIAFIVGTFLFKRRLQL